MVRDARRCRAPHHEGSDLILRSITNGSRECAPDDRLRDASRRMKPPNWKIPRVSKSSGLPDFGLLRPIALSIKCLSAAGYLGYWLQAFHSNDEGRWKCRVEFPALEFKALAHRVMSMILRGEIFRRCS